MDFLNDYPLPEYIKKEIREELEKLKVDEETAKKIVEKCYEVYLRNLVEPGEAAGIVAAQSIGEPGTQMSLPYEEKIIIKEGENVRIVEIGKFTDECIKKFGFIRQGIHEICDLPVDVYALSLDQDEKVHWKRIASVIRHKFSGKLVRIKTRSGRTITATPFHSFVIRQNNRIVPIEGRKLKIGDRIPVIRHMPLNCLSAIDLAEFVSYPVLRDVIKPINGRAISRTLELDFDFGYFLGIYLADGYSAKHFVSISNTNKEVLEIVKRFAERLGIKTAEYDNSSGKGHDIRLYSSVLSEFVKNFGCNAREKKIPDFVFGADIEFVRGLLRGYFDGDGSVNVERKTIRAFSSSKELIDGISLLLTRFGIFGVKRRMKGQHGIEISHRYAKKFAEEIGSSVPKKAVKLEKIAESDSKITYDLIDMIPSIGSALLDASKKLGYPLRVRKQKIGRATLQRHLARLERLATDEVKELKILKRAVESDVVWDEIVSIEEVDYDGYVYDLSVEGLETFTTAEGVITHNTMRTFHYAGVAEINVTLGLPRLIEILDVRKHPSTPMMTIRLLPEYAKDRNKAREIANRIEATHVLDVAEIVTDLRNMRIIIKPDEKALKRKGLDRETLKKKIEKSLKTEVEETEDEIIIPIKKPSNEDLKDKSWKPYKELMDTFEKLKRLVISGIKEIKRVIVRKEGEEYVLYTEGSNLKRIMKEEGIDFTRTVTNNIYEIYEVLGIEAARNAIVNEAISTLEEQGLEVDRRHIMLVADVMTADGELKQIGRHGVAGEKQSILARAAFEMTVNNLLEAAVRGEIDRLNGITENIIVGQPIKLGTGDVELVYGGSVNESRSE